METINLELTVDGQPSRVFELSRNHLPQLVAEVPVVSHQERTQPTSGKSENITVDRWKVDVLQPLPWFIGRFLTFQIVTVRSEIRWRSSELTSRWTVSVPDMEGLLNECEGVVNFEDHPEGTLLVLDGTFDLDLSAVPGIPGFLANYLKGRQGRLATRILENYLPRLKQSIEPLL